MIEIYKKSVITRLGSDDKAPYLIRLSLINTPWFSLKLHRILLSDDDCMHDHPWTFISFILKGGYVEQTPAGKKLYGPGSVLYRPAKFIHRLEIYQPAITLVITFKKVREWGFITPKGWIEWFRYTPSNRCE